MQTYQYEGYKYIYGMSEHTEFRYKGTTVNFNDVHIDDKPKMSYVRGSVEIPMSYVLNPFNEIVFKNFICWSNGINNLTDKYMNIIYIPSDDSFFISIWMG